MSTISDLPPEIQPEIQVTPAAANRVKKLIEKEQNNNLKLRIFITGGGCSGFQYGFSFEAQAQEDDLQIETQDITVIVDPLSMTYLSGATLDFKESLYGAHFSVFNPHAKTTCGCGSSFSIADTEDE